MRAFRVDAPFTPKLGCLYLQVLQPNLAVRDQRPYDFQVAFRQHTFLQRVAVHPAGLII